MEQVQPDGGEFLGSIDFVERLVQWVPELSDLYAEQLKDYDEVLPHVFLADVVRYVTDAALHDRVGTGEAVDRILLMVETALGSRNEEVANLANVSFLENLETETAAIQKLAGLIGPRTRAMMFHD